MAKEFYENNLSRQIELLDNNPEAISIYSSHPTEHLSELLSKRSSTTVMTVVKSKSSSEFVKNCEDMIYGQQYYKMQFSDKYTTNQLQTIQQNKQRH